MSFKVYKSVEVDVDVDIRVTADEVCDAIDCGDFSKHEVQDILEACEKRRISDPNGPKVPLHGLWSEQWVDLMLVMRQKFPNPYDLEEALKEAKIIR
jgi:hypothetical protein